MNTSEILAILKSDQAVKQIFLGVFPIDLLPKIAKLPAALVVNLDPSNKPGSHWVSLYFDRDGTCEYFDSYGRKPKELQSYIIANSSTYVFNNLQVQRMLTSTCGQMCIYVLIWRARGVYFEDIINSMNSDEFITGFVNSLFRVRTEVYNYEYIVNQIAKNL